MGRPLRFIPEALKTWTDSYGRKVAVVEVTIRAHQSRFLLRPTPLVRHVIVGTMAHVQAHKKFDIYGYAFLSNHGSYLVGVTDAAHQAEIMRDIHRNISAELSRKEVHDWPGGIFKERGRPIPIAGDIKLVERLKYCLSNSTKEHLVTRPDRWGGAHAAKALCGNGNGVHGRFLVDEGLYVDRTLADRLEKQGMSEAEALKASTKVVNLRLSKLPCWAHLSDEAYRQRMVELCKVISDEAAQARQYGNRQVLGMAAVLRHPPHHRPEKTDKSPAPMIHCASPGFIDFFEDAYEAFVEAYQRAMSTMHRTLGPVFFPEGGIPPAHNYMVHQP